MLNVTGESRLVSTKDRNKNISSNLSVEEIQIAYNSIRRYNTKKFYSYIFPISTNEVSYNIMYTDNLIS